MFSVLNISGSLDTINRGFTTTAGYRQVLEEFWVPILLTFIFAMAFVFGPRIYRRVSKWFPYDMATLKMMINGIRVRRRAIITFDEAIEAAGYSYDLEKDMFYSNMYAWQRNMGYCRLYDEAAALLSMIIDCEPIYFEYDDKRWLIEFWKGQYGMTMGCEIGVYATEGPDLDITGVFNGTFYYCVGDEDRLKMSFVLKKKDQIVLTRSDRHWWLTGFKLGEFSEPSDLMMDLYITLKNNVMRDAFIKGLMDAGYSQKEIIINGNTVSIKFDEPRTTQPYTRTKQTDRITQRKNKLLCHQYQDLTKEYNNSLDKISFIREQVPEMFEEVLNIGKTKRLFSIYEKIKKYLK